MLGTTLGHYRILEKIGAGGMGDVYRAHDDRLDRDVAVKVLPPGTVGDEAARKRIRKEARSLSRLNHPNIATVHDFGTYDGVDYIVMEYIAGKTIAVQLESGSIPEKEIIRYVIQLACALQEAHGKGIIHRDLKPGNLIVNSRHELKVLDFGLAMALDAGASDLTRSLTDSNRFAGTLPYMAPEQLRGSPADIRTDIWGAGAILYEMATGERPFPQPQYSSITEAILHLEPRRPTRLNPQISHGLENIILKCLEKTPARRYQTAGELLTALDQAQASSPALAKVPRQRAMPLSLLTRGSLLACAALGCILGLGGLYVNHVRRSLPQQHPLIVVGDFDNQSDNTVFDRTVPELLTTSLDQSHFLRLLPRSSIEDALLRMEKPRATIIDEAIGREICQREGLQGVVVGSIAPLGQNYVVMARAVSPGGETLVRVKTQAVAQGDLLKAIDRLAQDLRTGLGESLSSVQDTSMPLEQVTSSSLDAVRYFTWGRQKMLNGDIQGGIALIKRAIELDSGFAMAHAYLGIAYQNLGDIDRAEEQMRIAANLSGRATDTERLKINGNYNLIVGNFDGACEQFQALAQLRPQDPAPHHGLALCYADKRNWNASLDEMQKELALQPASIAARGNISRLHLTRGDLDSASAEAIAILKDSPAQYRAMHILGEVSELRQRFPEAEEQFSSMMNVAGDGEVEGHFAVADLHMATGRYKSARRHLESGCAAAVNLGNQTAILKYRMLIAELDLATGSRGESRILTEPGYQPHDPTEVFLFGRAYARMHRVIESRQMLKKLNALSIAKPFTQVRSLQSLLEAELALALKKPAEAIDAAERGWRYDSSVLALETLARSYEAADRPEDAIHAYEELLLRAPEAADNDDDPAFRRVVEAEYRLGKLYLRTGKADSARVHLQRFLSAWSGADPDLKMKKDAEKSIRHTDQVPPPVAGQPTPAT